MPETIKRYYTQTEIARVIAEDVRITYDYEKLAKICEAVFEVKPEIDTDWDGSWITYPADNDPIGNYLIALAKDKIRNGEL